MAPMSGGPSPPPRRIKHRDGTEDLAEVLGPEIVRSQELQQGVETTPPEAEEHQPGPQCLQAGKGQRDGARAHDGQGRDEHPLSSKTVGQEAAQYLPE